MLTCSYYQCQSDLLSAHAHALFHILSMSFIFDLLHITGEPTREIIVEESGKGWTEKEREIDCKGKRDCQQP